MRIIILALGLIFISSLSFAQSAMVGAKLKDSVSQEPLVGATIVLKSDSLKFGAISGADGGFFISSVPQGKYELIITYLGYKEYSQWVNVPKEQFLGDILVAPRTDVLEGVDVKERYAIGAVKGDTIEYNSKAFKTLQNSSARDLVEKVPGVRDDNGTIKAEGEAVQQVLVDGKPFFGQDANAALGSLPSNAVDKIQVFDDQSEQSKASGMDDGTRVKTINIVTKINMRYGEFGKVYAGYGTDGRFSAGTNINMFRGDQRFSVLGQVNNINQQNFSTADLLGVVADNSGGRRRGPAFLRGFSVGSDASDFMVNPSNGIISTQAGGMNYQGSFGEKWQASGSYFYNRANSNAITNTHQTYFLSEIDGQEYDEIDSANAVNTNHRFNAKLVYTISDKASMFILPSVTFQDNEGDQDIYSVTTRDGDIFRNVANLFESSNSALSWNNDLMFRQNFSKRGRSFFVRTKVGQDQTQGNNALLYNLFYADPTTWNSQKAELDQSSLALRSSVMFSEPIGDKGLAAFVNYDIDNTQEETEELTLDNTDPENVQVINNLSNINNNDWLDQQLGIGLRKFDRKKGFVLSLRYQNSSLLNDQSLPEIIAIERKYNNILPFALTRMQIKENGSLFAMYRTYTTIPRASQLQLAVDNSNPMQLSMGNDELDQQYTHYFRLRYKHANRAKSTVFFAGLTARYSNSYIGTSTFTAINDQIVDGYFLDAGAQISKPVNLSNYSNFNAMVNYGLPIKALKSNFNIDLNSAWSNTPTMVNNIETSTSSWVQAMGLTLASNISDKLDFTISSTSSYNVVNSAVNEQLSTSYFVQQSKFKYNWILPKGFTFRTQFEHQRYFGLTEGLDNTVMLWSAAIGKQILQNNRGEIQLTVFDILGQNNQISQRFFDTYYQESTSNVLTRYAMLTFVYNLQKFRSKPSKLPASE